MNKDIVIHLARTAGLADSPDDYHSHWTADDVEVLQRFAALVAAAEREQCAQILDDALGAAMLAKAQKNADGSDAYDNAIIDAVCMALDQYSTDIRSRT